MIYLDNAATSFPKPKQVYERMNQYLREEAANPGRSGHRMSVEAERQIMQARSLLARLFKIKNPDQLIFTLNCTDSLNIAMKGVLREGDHVITTNIEHNSVSRPLNALEKSKKVQLTRINASPEGFTDPSDIKKAIQKNTRLIAMTHASNVIGTIQPIRAAGKIAREKGILLLVDAAQTAGAVPIDVEADFIDMLAFPGHKSLYGPPGTGGLYVGSHVSLAPWREGGTGVDSESAVQPEKMPFLLESGTPNSVGIAGLAEGAEFILKEGVQKISWHEQKLVQKLRKGLSQIPGVKLFGSDDVNQTVQPVAFLPEFVDPAEFSVILDESFEIAARAGLHCAPSTHKLIGTFPKGCVRFSPGYFNTEKEIDSAIDAVKEIQEQFVR